MKLYHVEGEYHKQLPNGSHRVKAKILNPDLAMYINGLVVFQPDAKHQEWTVYTPKVFNARIVEFANSSKLWHEIKEACIDIVKLQESYDRMDDVNDLKQYRHDSKDDDVAIEDIDDEPINLDDIPF
jgi:hypothetical protein